MKLPLTEPLMKFSKWLTPWMVKTCRHYCRPRSLLFPPLNYLSWSIRAVRGLNQTYQFCFLPVMYLHLQGRAHLSRGGSCLGMAGCLIGASLAPLRRPEAGLPPCEDLSIVKHNIICQLGLCYWNLQILTLVCLGGVWIMSTSNFGHFGLNIIDLWF